ncbi:MAG: hydantoinase/oxoprolinase family protein [Caldiserica bacterium]|jgi:N-methylhydantoinase A|nr:hydantoinase/oxoprolinase family protein [Caldisericota bacterium]MDH7562261.1 hydantoinase/oxoprolinase family protein [Caldisericota bacterium]
MVWRIGIDIGGAFTDLFAVDSENGQGFWVKVESTPPHFEKGVLDGIGQLEEQGVKLEDTSQIIHGQTVVINTIVTRSGANVGFFTTSGFDVLEIQRANRRDIFNFKYKKPKPFTSRFFTQWIDERIDADKKVYKPLKKEELRKGALKLLEKGAESFAIGFINSYLNPTHEVQAKIEVQKALEETGIRGDFITISSDLSREWREYERFNTAVLNAYVQPIFVKYLTKLEKAFKEKGFNGVFYLTLAAGGMATSEFSKSFPIATVEGGPVAGIMGSIILGRLLDEKNLIVIDGGSTTTKAGLAKELQCQINTEYWIEQDEWNAGYPTRVPVININEIGTGGTSIVWVDEAGNLQVGPKAAGARPGPACYGMGGKLPTLTDAYLIAGYLNPDFLLGGKLRIDKELAYRAFEGISQRLKLDLKNTAYGAIRVANDNSSNLIRLISVSKGYDPREFSLVAHGGSGPMMAPFIAEELGIPKIIVPAIPSGVFNAWGMIGLDIRHELVQTEIQEIRENKDFTDFLNSIFSNLEEKILKTFQDEGVALGTVEIEKYLDLRYVGQAHTLKVSVSAGPLGGDEIIGIKNRFNESHFKEYGFSLNESGIEVVNFHVVGVHKIHHPQIEKQESHWNLQDAFLGTRKIFNGISEEEIPIYKKEKLPLDITLFGPCVVEGDTSTIIITPTFKAYHDHFGNFILVRK